MYYEIGILILYLDYSNACTMYECTFNWVQWFKIDLFVFNSFVYVTIPPYFCRELGRFTVKANCYKYEMDDKEFNVMNEWNVYINNALFHAF